MFRFVSFSVVLFSVLLGLATSSFSQETELSQLGDKAKSEFDAFYDKAVVKGEPVTVQEMQSAMSNLGKYWTSRGVYCRLTTHRRDSSKIRLRVTEISEGGIGSGAGFFDKKEWDKWASEGVTPKPHALCQLADDLWECDTTAELYYDSEFTFSDARVPCMSVYTDEREFLNQTRIILLSPDFPHFFENWELDPGLIYSRKLHELHASRRAREASPYHAKVNDFRLSMLPALKNSVDAAKKLFVQSARTEDGGLSEREADRTFHFMTLIAGSANGVIQIVQSAEPFLEKVSKLLKEDGKSNDAKLDVKFEIDDEDLVVANVRIAKESATFYLSDHEDLEMGEEALKASFARKVEEVSKILPGYLVYFRKEKSRTDAFFARSKDLEEIVAEYEGDSKPGK